mmetsp:Transcript_17968/g.32603  ORF Transcript_17968/g.32603 Transcript_17968/m.32603 type:complete len:136 (+) Transcript_17968:65-472(+)
MTAPRLCILLSLLLASVMAEDTTEHAGADPNGRCLLQVTAADSVKSNISIGSSGADSGFGFGGFSFFCGRSCDTDSDCNVWCSECGSDKTCQPRNVCNSGTGDEGEPLPCSSHWGCPSPVFVCLCDSGKCTNRWH